MDTPAGSVLTTVVKAVFLIFILLILGAVAFTGWIVSRYWHAIGV